MQQKHFQAMISRSVNSADAFAIFLDAVQHHLMYAADTYFKHENYFKINGSPVLFLYTLRDFQDFVEPLKAAFRQVTLPATLT